MSPWSVHRDTRCADLSPKMPPSSTGLTKEKVKEFLAGGNDIAIPILSLVKEVSGVFPPLQSAAAGALFIAENVKVRDIRPTG